MTDQSEQKRRVTLNSSETVVVDRHRDRIAGLAAGLSRLLEDDPEQHHPPAGFKQPRMATTLAVLGPRGAGKSTCMVALIHELSQDGSETVTARETAFRCLSGFLVVPQPVDCTLDTRDVPLGLAILMRLRRVLGLESADPESADPESAGPGTKAEQQAFETMRDAYMLNSLAAGRVLESTSVCGTHFSQQTVAAATATLALPDRVADWLRQAADRLGVKGFILSLDDVDLADHGLRGLIHSLLDELHQPRLILVLGADLPRLERRVADSFGQGDPIAQGAARDLLYKALPQQNREWLRPWTEEERWGFPSRPAPTFPEEVGSLKDLLLQRSAEWGMAIRNPALLPVFPRGLEDLWFALRGLNTGPDTREVLGTVEDYLGYLGEARGDHDLGRRISSRPAPAWARYLTWLEPIDNSQWEGLVTAALDGSPLLAFQADSDVLALPEDPSSAALWTELLLDLALGSGELSPSELIRRFPRMRKLVERAQIRTDFHRDEMARELLQARGSVMAKLTWTRFDMTLDRNGVPPEEFGAWVGLATLREALEKRRNAWPTSLAQGLYLRRFQVLDERQRAYDTDGAPDAADALLPRAVRPLVVFVDSLARAPWRPLSETPRRRSLRTNALLAAGLVRAAYVDALKRVFDALVGCGNVKASARHVLSETDSGWLDAVHDRGYTPVVEWTDDIVEARFHVLLKEKSLPRELGPLDLPEQDATHVDSGFVFAPYNALVGCLRAYTESRAFRHLADPGFDETSDETA